MKKLLKIAGLLVLVMGFGFVIGFMLRPFYSDTGIEEEISEGIEFNMLLGHLNRGEIEDAKRFLNLKLDTSLLKINSSLKNASETNRMHATKLFYSVATSRTKYPPDDSTTPEPVRERVTEILTGASQ